MTYVKFESILLACLVWQVRFSVFRQVNFLVECFTTLAHIGFFPCMDRQVLEETVPSLEHLAAARSGAG